MSENPKFLSDPLWHRIEAYELDDPGAIFTFSQKLAQQQQWSEQFTLRAISEYKRFIYLCCTSPTGASPPPVADEVWHLHLTYTVAYWQQFCRDTLHREVHHHPSRGGPDERHKHERWYAETLRLYRQTFGEDPPADIWPPLSAPPTSTPAPDHSPLRRHYRYGIILLALPFLYIICTWQRWNPYHLKGPRFLQFYILLTACCLLQLLLSLVKRQKVLHNVLQPVLPFAHTAELTYLAGGTRGTILCYIGSLLQTGALEWIEGDQYKINRELLTAGIPEHAVLQHETDSSIKLDRIEKLLDPLITAHQRKYMYLEVEYKDVLCEYILPALVLLMGIARMLQGIWNGRPVGFLIAEMVLLCVGYALISQHYNFHTVCMRLLRSDEMLSSHITAEFDRTMIFSGVAAVSVFPFMLHLERRFNPNGWNSTSGVDGGCGSGCGGGCGGCGGCGGD